MKSTLTIFVLFLGGIIALTSAQQPIYDEEIGAWHFHTYFFEMNENRTAEALSFRRRLREKINDGTFAECSLNQIHVGNYCIHPVSQFEMCCNSTSFAVANSYFVQNHGNLSVLIHPLTIYDLEDHLSRVSWIGQPVIMDTEQSCLYEVLPRPRPCPVYPDYPDELPTENDPVYIPIPGTEDYFNVNSKFNILTDPY